MSKKLDFGLASIREADVEEAAKRRAGPMGAAIVDVAGNLRESSEKLTERRRRNLRDAERYREAEEGGRLLVRLPLTQIRTDGLPRDRLDIDAVAVSDEMEELKSSIRARGQKEPIEVFRESEGVFQLKKGWRRLTALRQLYAETGDGAFSEVVARIAAGDDGRIDLYIDMVEENVIREDLTYAEMAQVAILAAGDRSVEGDDPESMVNRLYASLHKVKRSHIRSFVHLLVSLGDSLRFPKEVPRNLGLDVVRMIRERGGDAVALCESLRACADPKGQTAVLVAFAAGRAGERADAGSDRERAAKVEIHVGDLKVTAKGGECRIRSKGDYSSVDRERLERAVRAFDRVIGGEGG